MTVVRVLHIGDIVGKPGRKIVRAAVPKLRESEGLDFVVANAENSAGGSGITPDNFKELMKCSLDCITLGDHIYRRKAINEILENDPRVLKPANYPAAAPGRCWTQLKSASGVDVAVVSVLGRVFMKPVDCPWAAMDRVLEEIPDSVRVIMVDFHAEATSDMQVMGRYLDGRVSSVLGTHTHVTTADEQIFPGGTAFQCDIGMTGPHESILGRRIDRVSHTTRTFNPTPFDVAEGDVQLHGTIVEIDEATGKATAVRRLSVTLEEAENL